MYKLVLSAFLFLLLFNQCAQPSNWKPGDPLFKIEKDGRWGFINQQGVEVIKPIFRGIGSFTDSVAPARMNGTWGFIDIKGNFVIPAIYDYACLFSEGYALVWKDGKPFFIDHFGHKSYELPDSIQRISSFMDGEAAFILGRGNTSKTYRLKLNGEIIPDIFKEPGEEDGIKSREKNGKTEYALFDKSGKLIVPYGKYDNIYPFEGNLAQVSTGFRQRNQYQCGYIDRKGQLLFLVPEGFQSYNNHWSEGVIAISVNPNPKDGQLFSGNEYITWYDTLGKPFLRKYKDDDAMDFKNGRSFSGTIRNWYLMDKTGKQLSTNRFEFVLDNDFSDNMAIVAEDKQEPGERDIKRYGIIDSMGNYLVQPQFNHVHDRLFQKEGMLVAINEPLKMEHYSPKFEPIKEFWGLIDRKGNWIFPPKFTKVDPSGFIDGLLYVEIDSLYGYVNPKGDFVWKAIDTKRPKSPIEVHIDYMASSNYTVFESGISNKYIINQYQAKSIPKSFNFGDNTFGIWVNSQEACMDPIGNACHKTYIYNTTLDTFFIDCQDNRLYIIVQALNSAGIWKDIEYMRNSWCGVSYYKLKLLPNEFWTFEVPDYKGDFSTSLRLKFTWKNPLYRKVREEHKELYSNTFPGSVNPGQFWRKEGYQYGNSMDYYDE